ncbi:hypothetical protein [Streptomyces sp. NPDC001315]|uniref:hypothetical protein n=1 Tax=Streptomyces sp. NPDC001315 TaxID=3364562 RepID=UPI0036A32F26
MALDYRFRTVDFRPAPEGWRTAWITADGLDVLPMPGWLVREEFEYDSPNSDDSARSTGYRDVIAARVEDYGIEAIDATDTSFWFILGPGQSEPTKEEVAAEISRRKAALEAKGPR